VRAFGSTLFSLAILATAAPCAAVASGTVKSGGGASGGTSASAANSITSSTTPLPASESSTPAVSGGAPTTTAGGGVGPATTKPAVHDAPITSHSANLAYKGPLYQKTVTGEVVPYAPPPPAGKTNGATGGSSVGVAADTKPELLVPGVTARYVNGLAAAPMSAPAAVQEIIWAANQIVGLPYIWGGGHASFDSPGYDCSGTVSFALHGADLLTTPMDSSEFMSWDESGIGQWVTVFTNPEHAYMTVAGLRLDTSPVDDPRNQQGPRWRPLRPENHGFMRRHPLGL
jgi:cell wall-associated NlpC family hydrolase